MTLIPTSRLRKLLLAGTAIVGLPALVSTGHAQAVSVWSGNSGFNYNNAGNWTNGVIPTASGQTASFTGVVSTTIINVGTPVAPTSWIFNGDPYFYSVEGQAVSFAPLGGLTVQSGTVGISNDLTGSYLNLTGGSLSLSGVNAFDRVSITNGTLDAQTISALGASAALTIGSGGTLELTSPIVTAGSLDGNLTGTIVSNYGTRYLSVGSLNTSTTYHGTLADGVGALGLIKTGTGTLTLSNASAYSGSTQIEGGVLRATTSLGLSRNSAFVLADTAGVALDMSNTAQGIGSLAGGGTNGGNVLLGATGALNVGYDNTSTTYAGVISGDGLVAKVGTGTLTLSGANSYTGATSILGGVLQAGAANTLDSTAMISINAGTLDLNGYDQTIQNLNGFNYSSAVTLGTATLTIDGANSRFGPNSLFTGVISGLGGVSVARGSSLYLGGANTYTGTTTVSGLLNVSGSIASSTMVVVEAGGTLGGIGTLGDVTINGGTLAPGDATSAMNITGSLVLSAASRFMIEVSLGSAGRVNVSGSALLSGAAMHAHFAPGSYVAKQYTILTAAGGISSRFGSEVNTDLPANFTSTLSYDTSNVYLNLALAFVPPEIGAGFSANQQNVANTLVNYFNANGGIPLAFGGVNDAGLTQLSGETAAGAQQASFDAMTQFMGLMTDPFAAGRGMPGASSFAAEDDALAYAADGRKRTSAEREAFAMVTKAPPKLYDPRWNVWAAGFGGSRTTDGSTSLGSNRTTGTVAGGAVGADYWFAPTTVAGFSMAGGGTSFSVAHGGSGTSDLFQAGGFVRHMVGTAYVTAATAYGWQNIRTDRVALGERLRADFNANTYSGRIEAGNRWQLATFGGIGVTPYAAVQVTAFDLPTYAETSAGGLFALTYAGKTVTDTRSELGLRSDKTFAIGDALFTLRGRAAWAHDFNTDRNVQAAFQSLPGTSFVVNGATASRDAALTTASAEMSFVSGLSLAATFEGEFSDTTRSYAGKGVARYAW